MFITQWKKKDKTHSLVIEWGSAEGTVVKPAALQMNSWRSTLHWQYSSKMGQNDTSWVCEGYRALTLACSVESITTAASTSRRMLSAREHFALALTVPRLPVYWLRDRFPFLLPPLPPQLQVRTTTKLVNPSREHQIKLCHLKMISWSFMSDLNTFDYLLNNSSKFNLKIWNFQEKYFKYKFV